uniref:Uncharacterized protein MANES_08G052600 n=1 Tax=Rhizophora mucronata TaxID=61149 RepID=A0A2P2JC12_RHIMU
MMSEISFTCTSSRSTGFPVSLTTLSHILNTISDAPLQKARSPPSGRATTTDIFFLTELKGSTF